MITPGPETNSRAQELALTVGAKALMEEGEDEAGREVEPLTRAELARLLDRTRAFPEDDIACAGDLLGEVIYTYYKQQQYCPLHSSTCYHCK